MIFVFMCGLTLDFMFYKSAMTYMQTIGEYTIAASIPRYYSVACPKIIFRDPGNAMHIN